MRNLLAKAALLLALGSAVAARADITSSYLDDKQKAWSKYDPFEQFIFVHNDPRDFMNPAYFADALGDSFSALGRTGLIRRCMKSDAPAVWAICQGDIDAFDASKANAEVDADKAHVRDHDSAKQIIAETKGMIADHASQVKALFDKDDAYKKMFDVAAQARKQTYGSPELRALTLAMEDARVTGSRKALAGCADKVWPAWTKAVSAIPAKSFSMVFKNVDAEVHAQHAATVVGTPDGYLAAVALVACLPQDQLTNTIHHALFFWPGYRGPRNASQIAMMNAGLELDQRDAKIDWPRIDRRELFTGNSNAGTEGSGGSGRAPIVSIAPNGDKAHVAFGPIKTKMVKCADYRAGKRLSRIESDGRLVYEGTCYKYVDVMVTLSGPKPMDTMKRYTTGMKPGMYAGYIDDALLDASSGPAAKQPSVVFGVGVK